jgi:hypothetical protein
MGLFNGLVFSHPNLFDASAMYSVCLLAMSSLNLGILKVDENMFFDMDQRRPWATACNSPIAN